MSIPTPKTDAQQGGETPEIATGTQRSFWCRVLNEGASKPCNRLLVYCNAYIMPLSDSCCDAPECAVPVGDDGDYSWTGWVEESCEQCDTYWTFSGKVLAWLELPATDEAFREAASLQSQLQGARGNEESHRQYAHMMQEQRTEIANHCKVLEASLAARDMDLKYWTDQWKNYGNAFEKASAEADSLRAQLADAQKEAAELRQRLGLQ